METIAYYQCIKHWSYSHFNVNANGFLIQELVVYICHLLFNVHFNNWTVQWWCCIANIISVPPDTGASTYCVFFSLASLLIVMADSPSMVLQSMSRLPACTLENIPPGLVYTSRTCSLKDEWEQWSTFSQCLSLSDQLNNGQVVG